MKNWAIIFLTMTGLAGGTVLADAPDGAIPPATLPAAVSLAAEPATTAPASALVATDPAATQPAATQVATTQDATTQPADADALAATNPSTAPSTQPVATTGPTTMPALAGAGGEPSRAVGSSRILPGEFVILAQKSIFQRGNHTAFMPRDKPKVQTVVQNDPLPGSKSPSAEDQLVFDGTTEAGTQTLAFVEDRGTYSMLILQDGDKVATGTVSEITLDSLDYTSKGRVVHVQVGQNLKGVDALPATETIAVAPVPATQSGPPGALVGGTPGNPLSSPTSPPAAGGSSGASVSDIVAKLKAKRARELGN